MTSVSSMTVRSFRLPAFCISGVRQRGASRLSKSPSSKRSSQHLPPHQPSTPRVNKPEPSPTQAQGEGSSKPSISDALASASPSQNNLLAPVHIPEDPNAILKETHPATSILANSGLVVQREIEMMNLVLGIEQANRYVIMDPQGNHVGYLLEHGGGFGKMMGRQWLKTHRSFTTHVFNREQEEVLRFHRPFSWVNTRIRVYDPLEPALSSSSTSASLISTTNGMIPGTTEQSAQLSSLPLSDMRVIGEARSDWALLKRKYNLFSFHSPPSETSDPTSTVGSDLSAAHQMQGAAQSSGENGDRHVRFAYVDEPPLSWDFSLRSSSNKLIGSVNRNFGGLARELFTDTSAYVLRLDAAGLEEEANKSHIISQTAQEKKEYKDVVGGERGGMGMTLDQRAVMLAMAVTVDFDYFSRHSRTGDTTTTMPLLMVGEDAAAVAGAEAGVGVRAAGADGEAEDAAAGAGTMAGYSAMQMGMGGGQYGDTSQQQSPTDDASPQAPQQGGDTWGQQGGTGPDGWGGQGQAAGKGEEVWGQNGKDPWSDKGRAGGRDGDGGGDGDGDGDGGGGSFWDDFDE